MNNPIIVTGASGGIGMAVISELRNQGFGIIAIDQNIDNLASQFDDDFVIPIKLDITNFEILNSSLNELKQEYGAFRGFVHCAGFDKLMPLYLTKITDLNSLFSVHVFSPIMISSFLAKKGNMTDGASIVLISSLSAHEGAGGHSAYASAKGAVEGFIASAASELVGKKIRINVIIPGVVKTKMSEGFIGKLDPEQNQKLMESYPLGIGSPIQVAKLITFLVSDESSWVTGQKFVIDGGHSIRSV
jgi:NAD(P)-dependent dehydrogenase (short-subunit alcohol dehydrogenase family)